MGTLNEALRLVRVFHDLNQTKLAETLEISKSYISEIESGKKPISMELLKKYSEYFNIPASSLLLFSEEMESGKISEKSRFFIAKKIIKMMAWAEEMKAAR
jgi:transcriptional regulator with XRE-family HTH domain